MTTDYISIGSSPVEEDCVQVGSDNYLERELEECKRFVELLVKKFGEPPAGARYRIKTFPHDFGSYREVCVVFDDTVEDAVNYAYFVEENTPLTWEDDSPLDYKKK